MAALQIVARLATGRAVGPLAAAALGLAVSASAAIAQDIPSQMPQDGQAMPSVVLNRSMADLLAAGYEIVSFSAGLAGLGYLLRHEHAWVICTVGLYGETKALKSYSRCEQLSR